MISSISQLTYLADAKVNSCGSGNDCSTGLPTAGAGDGALHTVITWVLGIAAGAAVIIIIIAALRLIYAAKDGDSAAVSQLRNTIIMTGIGLVVILTADAIVTYVVGRV